MSPAAATTTTAAARPASSAPIDLKAKVRRLPHKPGVYLMKDRLGRILYVGKAKNLKKRVSSYFMPSRAQTVQQPKIRALIGLIADFDTIEVKSEPEALLLEGRLIKQWRPKYNTDFVDDKRFLLVRVDPREELPRVRLTRIRKDTASRYFGPFAHSGPLRKTLAQMRRQFGILLADSTPQKLPDGRWQLYDDIRQEIYGEHPNTVTPAEYRARVESACDFLEGKSREMLETLRAEMRAAAEKHFFEKAAELRDIVFALEETLKPARRFEREQPLPQHAHSHADTAAAAVAALQAALALPAPPARMECFDISHISGTYVVASCVHFHDGRPDKNNYRRFRIKSFTGNDDFRAMEEVVGRRYARLRNELNAAAAATTTTVAHAAGRAVSPKPPCGASEIRGGFGETALPAASPAPAAGATAPTVTGASSSQAREQDAPATFPDLVVIDGGRGQVASALKAFLSHDIPPPALIGLAKKHETIIFPDARPPLNLPYEHPALQLLQRLRDEAHRFANTYNADLRSQKIRESVLDDFPGMGEVRRAALMEHFGDIDKLRAATAEKIAEVEGFGEKLAAELWTFLHPQNAA